MVTHRDLSFDDDGWRAYLHSPSPPAVLQAATIDVCRATAGANYEPLARATLPLHVLLTSRDGRVNVLTLPLRGGRDNGGRVIGSIRVSMRLAMPLAQVRVCRGAGAGNAEGMTRLAAN